MRKNYFLIDVVEKAKCFGYTDEEVYLAVKEGIKRFEQIVKTIEETNKKAKEKVKERIKEEVK